MLWSRCSPTPINGVQRPSSVGEPLFEKKIDSILEPIVLHFSKAGQNSESVEKVILVVDWIVTAREFEENHRIVPVRFENSVIEEEF